MMRYTLLVVTLTILVTLASAKYSPSRSNDIAYCIQNDDAQMMCTNHCGKGKTCTGTCGPDNKGFTNKWQIKVDPKTAKANFISKTHPHAHIRQDQWPCSHYVIENHISKKDMCPKMVDGKVVKTCMDVRSGVVRKAGYVGVI